MRPVLFPRIRLLVPVGLVLVAAALPRGAQAYGEGSEELPSWEERAVHLFTDRLRVEPGADDPEFASYEAVRPLVYSAGLNEAARFYADDMAQNSCFPADHSSCDGTPFGTRLAGFYAGDFIGENISWGSTDPRAVVTEGWLYSPPHRDNMLHPDWLELGTGYGRWKGGDRYWVQDFGSRGSVEEPITTSAVHWPLRPAAGAPVNFYLAVYDPSGEPNGAELVVDGSCDAMDHDRGSGKQQTYLGTTPAGDADCVPYYFVLTRMDGAKVTHPTSGAFLMPVGGEYCALWTDERDSIECNPEEDRPVMTGEGGGCGAFAVDSGSPDGNVGSSPAYASCRTAGGGRGSARELVLLLWVQGLLRRRRTGRNRGGSDQGPGISSPGS